jgi:hypothetical protein
MNKYMERGTLRKRSKSPVRFRNHTRNNNLSHTNGRARALSKPMPMNENSINKRKYFANIWSRKNDAIYNRDQYRFTKKWSDEMVVPLEFVRESARLERMYHESKKEKPFNWTCGLYGCVQRFFGRGGTRRHRKQKTTLKRNA